MQGRVVKYEVRGGYGYDYNPVLEGYVGRVVIYEFS